MRVCSMITDKNWQDVPQECGLLPRYLAYGSADMASRRIIPVSDQPSILVPEDEWKERINEANEYRLFPIHHMEAANVPVKNQARTNFCWSYGIASCTEAHDLIQGQPYEKLAPATLGHLVKWRNQGYWCSEAIAGANKYGHATSKFADDGVYTNRNFKDGWQADALRHRPLEWWDTVGSRAGSEKEMVQQCVSLLLTPSPLYIAYNWWGHALMMAGLIWDEKEKYNLRWVAVNSHDDGRIELTGSRGVPDEGYGIRSTVHSVEIAEHSEALAVAI